jgi:hypothetical protein
VLSAGGPVADDKMQGANRALHRGKIANVSCSGSRDIQGLFAFGPLRDVEQNLLTLFQSLEAVHLNR